LADILDYVLLNCKRNVRDAGYGMKAGERPRGRGTATKWVRGSEPHRGQGILTSAFHTQYPVLSTQYSAFTSFEPLPPFPTIGAALLQVRHESIHWNVRCVPHGARWT
jgi:hypothetical protein